ncbi:MAG TPA: hypothetical protein VH165_02385 [Kofleriaceae bacterium]|jgi:hypothetical protein|nr:hypothetical protein [Kofleriaceae bacterium]
MTFREALVSGSGTPTWSIPLATHQRTDIPNLTMEPALVLAGPRKQAEVRFHKYRQRRPPTAGYNCFGHAFALRRTAIYDLDRTLLDTILDDDGYAEVADPDIEVGDIVMYFDDRGEPFHAGEVIRREPLLIGLSSAIASTVPIVLSKLDDISGEYEHKIDEALWPDLVESRKVYRARQRVPRRKWRDIVAGP